MAKKEIAQAVGIVALGGIADIGIEYVTSKFAKQEIVVGQLPLNAQDAAGIGTGLLSIGYGMAAKSNNASLFGAGAIAAAIATIFGKALMYYNPLSTRVQASAPVMQVMQPSYIPQIAPTIEANTGGMLLVGSSGGGKQVYKSSAGEESNADLTQIMLG